MRARLLPLPLLVLLAACAGPDVHDAGPAPPTLTAPPADWSALVGTPVRIEAPLTVLDTNGLAHRGDLLLAFGSRLPVPTEVADPGDAANALAAGFALREVRLGDGVDTRPVDPAEPLPFVPGAARLRAGSTLEGIDAVVRQDADGIVLVPTAPIATIVAAPRPPVPVVPGALRLGSFNVLNLFNGDGRGGGFPTLRGAKSDGEYRRQQAKLVASVQALAPDAAALMEIENDGYGPASALAQFVAALNAAGPARDYAFVDAHAGPGDNPIRVAIVYRTSKLRADGAARKLDGGPFAERSRVPLAQVFQVAGSPADSPRLQLVAVHLKSKGCGSGDKAATGADADQGDGQSCFNATRVESARRIVGWMGELRSRAAVRTVLLGDFNSYAHEDPLRVLFDAGWVDAFERFPEDGPAYSFVFDGRAGRLDHALLDRAAAERLRGAAHWHNNADEPEASGYAVGVDDSAYGASDHDVLVIGGDWAE